MSSLFPRRSPVDRERGEARVLRVDEDAADDVFAALGSATARTILGALYEEPGTATDVADAADTSLQNARYHLEKLVAADLVEQVDTWYSERGTEMTVYGPTSEGVVVFAGEESERSRLRAALARVLATVTALLPLGGTMVGVELLKRLLGSFALVGAAALLLAHFGPQYTPWGLYASTKRSGGGEYTAPVRSGADSGGEAAFEGGGAAVGTAFGWLTPELLFLAGALSAVVLVLAVVAIRRRVG